MEKLNFTDIGHAAWRDSHTDQLTLAAVRYFNFFRESKVEEIVICGTTVRFAPNLLGQPEHVIIEHFSDNEWKVCFDGTLPPFDKDARHVVKLSSITTKSIRLICDREHPVLPCHGDLWSRPELVPYQIFNNVEFFGEHLEKRAEPPYHPPLKKGRIEPSAELNVRGPIVSYKSDFFQASFSLRRPLITSLGWDNLGEGKSSVNLLPEDSMWELLKYPDERRPGNTFCGPLLANTDTDTRAVYFGGEVEVIGNCVHYKKIHCNDDYDLDVKFTLNAQGMDMTIVKTCHHDYTAIEGDDWRFTWDCRTSVVATLGEVDMENQRTGRLDLPVVWNAPGFGSMGISGEGMRVQVDSYRKFANTWCGFELGGDKDKCGFVTYKKGTYTGNLKIQTDPANFRQARADKVIPRGLRRGAGGGLGFRGEFCGYSNHAASCNCHLTQFSQADYVAYLADFACGVSPIACMRWTLEVALRGGPGYGDNRSLYMDTDPSLLIALGLILKAEPHDSWLLQMWPLTMKVVHRVIELIDETGLLRCKSLTGNSGSKMRSTNAWDVVSFGNYDAYSNALAYRGLVYAQQLATIAGDGAAAALCESAHLGIKAAYEAMFKNPDHGTVSGWVSADGKHHDYLFTFINNIAMSLDLVSKETQRQIAEEMESGLRDQGLDYFYYGLPTNLRSIRAEDVPCDESYLRADGLDKYGVFVNGALTTGWMSYYLIALRKLGLHEKADMVSSHLESAFADGTLIHGEKHGGEFFTHEGRPCGYEGILPFQFPVLAAMAIDAGICDDLGLL